MQEIDADREDSIMAPFDPWDPLDAGGVDPGIFIAAQRREINNILKSYTGYFALFSEMIQNALDAVERRARQDSDPSYAPKVWLQIDMDQNSVSVTDNGCGMTSQEFRQFLRPTFSFKEGTETRGSKGVGATYLAYGFNSLEVGTRIDQRVLSGLLNRGRDWVEDSTGTISRPMVEHTNVSHHPFSQTDRGTSMTVRLVGQNIRPNKLGWQGATTAVQWLNILRVVTPLGALYFSDQEQLATSIEL
jgi:DNA topoisomerase VI subunit B